MMETTGRITNKKFAQLFGHAFAAGKSLCLRDHFELIRLNVFFFREFFFFNSKQDGKDLNPFVRGRKACSAEGVNRLSYFFRSGFVA